MKKLSGKQVGILVGGVIAIALFLLIITNLLSHRVAENPPGTVGNTAGNLYNGGMFCEKDGRVYFTNVYDENTLYSMDIMEGEVEKLGDVAVQNLLAGTDVLYYFQTGASHSIENLYGITGTPTSLNRCSFKGKNETALQRDIILGAQLVDNSLYVMVTDNEENTFLKMNRDGSDKQELSKDYIHPGCGDNGMIYYTDPTTHGLCSLDTTTDVSTEILAGNIWFPIKQGDYIYYVDADRNYSINRYSLSENTIQVLTNDRVDFYNVGNGYIYYQTAGSTPQLKFMNVDGSMPQVLAEGAYNHIHMTSAYVYFQDYGQPDTLYHSYIGSGDYTEFTASKDAAARDAAKE